MNYLVNRDHQPEQSVDGFLVRELAGPNEPDDRPTTIEKVVRGVDDRQAPQRNSKPSEDRNESQGVGEAVLYDRTVQELALRLVHGLILGLEEPVADQVG